MVSANWFLARRNGIRSRVSVFMLWLVKVPSPQKAYAGVKYVTYMKAQIQSNIVLYILSWFRAVMPRRGNKVLLSLSIPPAWRDDIDRRALALNLTRATYATLILAKWRADGMPAVTEPDRLVQLARKPVKP
jgi:hypothetical protein